MKIALFTNHRSFLSRLTKIVTKSETYHIAFITDDYKYIYEMNIRGMIRKRVDETNKHTTIKIYDCPVVIPEEYLIEEILERIYKYGFLDYILFGIRALGVKLTIDGEGIICSEHVNETLHKHGYKTPWNPDEPPPSPADFERFFATDKGERDFRFIGLIKERGH